MQSPSEPASKPPWVDPVVNAPLDSPSRPAWVDPVVPAPSEAPRGNYGKYHEALEKRVREREARLGQPLAGDSTI